MRGVNGYIFNSTLRFISKGFWLFLLEFSRLLNPSHTAKIRRNVEDLVV